MRNFLHILFLFCFICLACESDVIENKERIKFSVSDSIRSFKIPDDYDGYSSKIQFITNFNGSDVLVFLNL
ncbi:hypothetical protein A3SI_18397 [Nitritalea halalkaliphila LW7]|uniref:Uncharacterized protein n=1 Tax=Nitritalea halalkaliphila LW7 TaxID=1189621 RepID=I5BU25_9BACT|nr:hypothetical protein A3SI_18397 [Nitritalea halalkaliphila LW7]